MEKIIDIDIDKEEYFFEKYNHNLINKTLINHIINESIYTKKHDTIKLIINNNTKLKIDINEELIKGFNRELDNLVIMNERNNLIQLALLFLGIVFLFLSRLFSNFSIWQEVLVIIGWVPIWEMIDLELFRDFKNRRKIYIIKKLLKSEIIVNS